MSLRYTAAALAWGLMASTAQAAPIAVPATGLKHAAGAISNVEKAAVRCWWRNGQKYCRPADLARAGAYRERRSEYFVQDASKLPFGSWQWWYVKEREGSAGRP
jgi:hypothetical protein